MENTKYYNDIRKFNDEAPKVILFKCLQVNKTKTEEYVINKENNCWKKCKLLDSPLDTLVDIKRKRTAYKIFSKRKESHQNPKYKCLKHISNLFFCTTVKFEH